MTNAAYAFILSALTALIIGPKMIQLLTSLKLRQTISEDVPDRHQQKAGTPMMGGVIILLGAAVGIAFFRDIDPRVIGVILLTLSFAAIGFIDDFLIAARGKSLGLKARQKLIIQFALAIIFVVWANNIRGAVPTEIFLHSDNVVNLGWTWYPLTVLLIVGMSNAFNLADGLDGLVSGMTALLALALGALIAAYAAGLTVVAWAIAGGCVGFLWYNCNPAKVFMGDTGSMALGVGMTGIAIVARMEFFMLILGAIFVIEALSVIIQVISFKTTGKRPFKMTPIHHHFELSGWAEQEIVTRFWIIQGLICIFVLSWVGMLRIWD